MRKAIAFTSAVAVSAAASLGPPRQHPRHQLGRLTIDRPLWPHRAVLRVLEPSRSIPPWSVISLQDCSHRRWHGQRRGVASGVAVAEHLALRRLHRG